MRVDRDKFLAALMAAGLISSAGCGSDPDPVQEDQTMSPTSGSEDTYMADPVDTGDDLEADTGDDMGGGEAEEDLGPTPE